MILQEVIRNIVLYNAFIKPWLKSVSEYLLAGKSKVALYEANSFNKLLVFPLTTVTGTHTIAYKEIVSQNFFERRNTAMTRDSALNGNGSIGVLMEEDAVGSSKSGLSAESLRINFSASSYPITATATTGFIFENTYLFFSHETHEQREYLGEFSLPHEENLFNSFIERR